ncbi:hypothetical protein FLP10_09080 [Agromyces intestinalis]|uniref:Uncharacterized protein n=1 Tax=Agromyces intestinalis TaxID=2592652 RepID=A0A5C1YGA5_9MICO|nr:hypothetical protein [Agromyces intestinalis]QEO14555.1 hypothetical protein FLP10_09080 [Agromyces intestinalis]
MTQTHDEVTERAYLEEVRREVAAIDPAQADGIVAELAEHLREARADAAERGEAFDLDAALSDLGDPAVIAAAVERPAGDPVAPAGRGTTDDATAGRGATDEGGTVSRPDRPVPTAGVRRFLDSTAGVAITLVLIGIPVISAGFWAFLVGLVLLWNSRRWRLGDKVFATVAIPATMAFFLLVLRTTGFGYLWTALVLAPPAIALVLLLRLRRSADDRWRVLQVPRAPRYDAPRGGVLGVADRWPGAVLAVAAVPVATAIVTVPTLVSRSWAALPVTGWIAALVLTVGIAELLVSRGWSTTERILGVLATGAAGAVLAVTLSGVIGSIPGVRACQGDVCIDLAPGLPDPVALLDPLARFVLPFVLVAVGWAAARFRSAREQVDSLDGWPAAIAAAVAMLFGAVAVAAVFALRTAEPAAPGEVAGSAIVAAWLAIAGSLLWLVGVIVVLRSRRWGSADRLIATISAPLLWLGALLVVDSAATAGGRYYGSDPNPSLTDSLAITGAWPVVLAIAGAMQLAIAARLLVAGRRRPLGS